MSNINNITPPRKANNKINIILFSLIALCLIGAGVALFKAFNPETLHVDMEVRTTEDYVQYKYKDETEWNNLVKIETLASGKNAGREIEIKTEDDAIKWKYSDASEWVKLVDLKALAGKDGKDGENGTDGKDGTNGINGTDGVDGKDGEDGIDGEDGVDGEDGEDGANGEDAQAWINLGEVKTEDFCAVRFEYTDDENEYCGLYSDSEGNHTSSIYVERIFPDALAGNYNFIDEDGDEWSVRVEKNKNDGEDSQSALIEFWYNNGDGKKGYIYAIRWSSDDEWEISTYNYATTDEVKEALSKYDWIDLGVPDTDWETCFTFENTDEEFCGYMAYIAETFPDYSEGRYKFHDGDGAQWLVKVEKNVPDYDYDNDERHVLIEIWGESWMNPQYIQGDYYGEDSGWELYYYTYTFDSDTSRLQNKIASLESEVSTLKEKLEKYEWKDLGVVYLYNYEYDLRTFMAQKLLENDEDGKYIFWDEDIEPYKWYADVLVFDQEEGEEEKTAFIRLYNGMYDGIEEYTCSKDYDNDSDAYSWGCRYLNRNQYLEEKVNKLGIKKVYAGTNPGDYGTYIKNYFNKTSVFTNYNYHSWYFYKQYTANNYLRTEIKFASATVEIFQERNIGPNTTMTKAYLEYRLYDDPTILYYCVGTVSGDVITWGETQTK